MSVYDDHSWDRLTEIRRKTLEENGGQLQGSWGVIKDKDGSKLYKGFLWHNRPYGPGAEYYKNGKVFREGIWDIKGIVAAREYYENGQLRFEGIWRIHLSLWPESPSLRQLLRQRRPASVQRRIPHSPRRGGLSQRCNASRIRKHRS